MELKKMILEKNIEMKKLNLSELQKHKMSENKQGENKFKLKMLEKYKNKKIQEFKVGQPIIKKNFTKSLKFENEEYSNHEEPNVKIKEVCSHLSKELDEHEKWILEFQKTNYCKMQDVFEKIKTLIIGHLKLEAKVS